MRLEVKRDPGLVVQASSNSSSNSSSSSSSSSSSTNARVMAPLQSIPL